MPAMIILIKSPDQKGLVSRISTLVFERGFNILDCQQHVDLGSGLFFMRLKLDLEERPAPLPDLEAAFEKLAAAFQFTWSVHYTERVERVAILVTKAPHCLYDLLVRQREGELPCEVPVIISNHDHLAQVARQFGVDYCHLPVTSETRAGQESAINDVLRRERIGLVVLARYMQVLSPGFVAMHTGRIINIHHAFLPAFQGANAYQQAYSRGVKMIGATAHYVTEVLDEGPIIEQDVERVSHEDSPKELQRIGRDIERIVLARAVKAHLEHRVIVAGRRAIVFSAGV
ncbi:MAG: formyltetrahydrofolate deformylase [Candidatus Zixiibacteriota bacterium]